MWTFTTGAAPDTTPPTVVSTIPANAATGVAISQAVSATFSEAMNPLTITTATFQLAAPGGALIAATVAYDPITSSRLSHPRPRLAYSTTYTATITTGETDLAGQCSGQQLHVDLHHRGRSRHHSADGGFDHPCQRSHRRGHQSGR